MVKLQIIGHVGRDSVVQVHGTDSVINFSICHTDKYKDASGQKHERATWVTCSWWLENTNVAQYIKKGSLLFVEGIPEAKQWKHKQTGELTPYLNLRVMRVELLGGKRDENQSPSQQAPQGQTDNSSDVYVSFNTNGDDDSLPF